MLIRPFATFRDSPVAPFVATRGEGHWLFDEDGGRLLDGVSGMWHVPLGYSCRPVAEAAAAQLHRLQASSLFSVSHQPALMLAERLPEALGLVGWRCFLLNSGADAVEAALTLAERSLSNRGCRAAPQAVPGGFHGNSGAIRALPRLPVPEVGDGVDKPVILFEPVQGVAGVRQQAPDVCRALIRAQAGGAVLISDEIGCGLWRTGHAVAARGLGVQPDIVLVSKGLTNGCAPLSAVLISPAIASRMADLPFEDGRTAGGSPIGCAAGLAVLDELLTAEARAARATVSARLKEVTAALAASLGGTVRHYGLLAGVELPLAAPLDLAARARANALFVENGLLCRIAADGVTTTFAPGYGYGEEEFATLAAAAARTLTRLLTIAAESPPRRAARA